LLAMKKRGLVFCFGISVCLCWQPSRREVVTRTITTAGLIGVATTTDPAWAARGAAELDLEYYFRSFIGGNRKEGNVQASLPPTAQPPRVLGDSLSRLLLTDDFAAGCLTVDVLVQTVISKNTKGTRQNNQFLIEEIQTKARNIRDKASRSFFTRAPWQKESITDQYYFDLSCYSLWRAAAEVLPNYADRDVFIRNVGRALYQQMIKDGLLSSTPSPRVNGVVGTVGRVRDILDVFTLNNFCKSYHLGPDDPADTTQGNIKKKVSDISDSFVIVDDLDDEALASGGSVDFLVSIFEPATLGAALQITGEQSRFVPDVIGPTLSAMWEETAGLACTWETFFIDPVYRPNPKDYFPNEQLFQYTLTKQPTVYRA
jgi:hypothetical protein